MSVAGVGAAGLTGAALIGCSSSSKKAPPSGAAQQPAGSPAAGAAWQPKRGGTLKVSRLHDIDSLDMVLSGAGSNYTPTLMTMSKLVRFHDNIGGPAIDKIEGDAAKTWELPDHQTIIFHLDPAAKFDARPPLNGRALTADDVVQSWKRFAKDSTFRTTMAHSALPQAPISSVEAVDAATVRIKLAFVDSATLALMAGSYYWWIQPVEGLAGKYDMTKEIYGSGPFILEKWQSSIGFTYKRNPNWHGGIGNGRPYLDGFENPIISESAQMEAQFRSKNLHFGAVSPENTVATAKELKGTEVTIYEPSINGQHFGLSWLPGQPWHDIRVRRAVSMAMNRDTFAEVFFEPKQYEKIGVKLGTFWNSPMTPVWGDYWLDPKGPDFGPAAAWLKHNIPEAKKLLEAAGYTSAKPLEFDLVYPGIRLKASKPQEVDAWAAMVRDAGIKLNNVPLDYQTEYIPKYWRGRGKFEGRNVKAAAQESPGGGGPSHDPLAWLIHWVSSWGNNSVLPGPQTFPQLDEMIKKLVPETDAAARKQGVRDLQRFIVDQMVVIPAGPATKPTGLKWQVLHGPGEIGVWGGGEPSAEHYYNFWFDRPI